MVATSALALLLALSPARADGLRLILNDPTTAERPVDECLSEACLTLVELIDGAEHSIDFAIYGIRGQSQVFSALLEAKARGVQVRGVVDRTVQDDSYYTDTDDLMEALGGVHTDLAVDREALREQRLFEPTSFRCDRPPGFEGPLQCLSVDIGDHCFVSSHASREPIVFQGDIMHHKFFVIDRRVVWSGSTNISNSGTGGYNANLVTVVDSSKVARFYQQEFEQMYEDGLYHDQKKSRGPRFARVGRGTAVKVWFSPQDRPISHAVRRLIQQAQESIDVAVFFLTHTGIAEDLIDAHLRGVEVRVIIDATAAKNGYTKHELLRVAGIPVKVEDWGGKMHMKAAVIDQEILITGSMNWTWAGERGNDENTIVVYSPRHANQFAIYYDRIWSSIPDRWLQGRPDPEALESGTSCADGMDNDFDDRADATDPGCRVDPPPLPELPPYTLVPKESGQRLVKGVVADRGRKVYVAPGELDYDWMVVDPDEGGRWFCNVHDAREAGFKRHGYAR